MSWNSSKNASMFIYTYKIWLRITHNKEEKKVRIWILQYHFFYLRYLLVKNQKIIPQDLLHYKVLIFLNRYFSRHMDLDYIFKCMSHYVCLQYLFVNLKNHSSTFHLLHYSHPNGNSFAAYTLNKVYDLLLEQQL